MAVTINDDKSITLSGADVFGKIKINGKAVDYNPTSTRAGEKYYRATYNGSGMTVEADVRDAIVKGDVAEITIVQKEYARWMKPTADPMHPVKPGEEADDKDDDNVELITRRAYEITGYVTHTQMGMMKLAAAKVDIGVEDLRLEFDVKKAKAMKELKLDDTKVAALTEAI
jgi:hypothetical protein